jgi:tRNA(fMet)-specific endonuclease VapC
MMYMLDSSACIHLFRGRVAIPEGETGLRMSVIVFCELLIGAEKSDRPAMERDRVFRLSVAVPVIAFTADVGPVYATIRADLERRGETIGPLDLLIAAHALALGATLVTGNDREFRRVRELKVENWSTPRRKT